MAKPNVSFRPNPEDAEELKALASPCRPHAELDRGQFDFRSACSPPRYRYLRPAERCGMSIFAFATPDQPSVMPAPPATPPEPRAPAVLAASGSQQSVAVDP